MDLIHINIERVNDTDKYIAMFSYKDVLQMERKIISRYFVQGYRGNEIASVLGVNISQLNRQKENAIVYFALLLDCECYKDNEQHVINFKNV